MRSAYLWECPSCGSPPFHPCRSARGSIRLTPHRYRTWGAETMRVLIHFGWEEINHG